jgi:hypothetical protein
MNTAFTALFSIECMLKIISFGVRVSRSSAILSKKQNKTKNKQTGDLTLDPTNQDTPSPKFLHQSSTIVLKKSQ